MNQTMVFIDAHTHRFQSNETRICFHTYRHGVHPWLVKKGLSEEQLNHLRFNPPPYLGEVGIDRIKGEVFELQKKVFTQYLELARELNLPLIVHAVRSHSDIAGLLKKLPHSRVLIHGFTGKLQQAQMLLERGCFLSFGAGLIDNQHLQQVLLKLPLDKIFFETDDQENVAIDLIYQKASSILGITIEDLQKEIYQNARKLYGNEDDWKKMD